MQAFYFSSLKFQFCIFSSTGSCNPHSVTMNNELIDKIERMSRLTHLVLVKLSTAATAISPLLVAFINYCVLSMGDESFRFDGTLWLPFEPNQPVGFFAALLFQSVSTFADFCLFTPIVCIFIGACWCIVAFLSDIARNISHLKRRKIFTLNGLQLIERFCHFARFHADVMKLSGAQFISCAIKCVIVMSVCLFVHHFSLTGEFNAIYELMIISVFLFGLGTVASSLIVFQSVE